MWKGVNSASKSLSLKKHQSDKIQANILWMVPERVHWLRNRPYNQPIPVIVPLSPGPPTLHSMVHSWRTPELRSSLGPLIKPPADWPTITRRNLRTPRHHTGHVPVFFFNYTHFGRDTSLAETVQSLPRIIMWMDIVKG